MRMQPFHLQIGARILLLGILVCLFESVPGQVRTAGPNKLEVTQTIERLEGSYRYSFRVTNNGDSALWHFFVYLKFQPRGVVNSFLDNAFFFSIQEAASVLDARNLDPSVAWVANLFGGPPFPPAGGIPPGESLVVQVIGSVLDESPKLYGYETVASGAAAERKGPEGSQGRIAATGFATDPEPLLFAQFGNGNGFTADTVVTNPSSTKTVEGRIDFLADDGSPLEVGIASVRGTPGVFPQTLQLPTGPTSSFDFSIPARGSITISTDGAGDESVAGSAIVTSDGSLGGVVRFRIPGIGIAGVGSSLPAPGVIAPVRRMAGGINSGVALQNPGSFPITLSLTLQTQNGQTVANRIIEDFPARGHLAQFIDQLFPEVNTNNFTGTIVIEVQGTGRIAATVLELGSSGEFTTLPITPLR